MRSPALLRTLLAAAALAAGARAEVADLEAFGNIPVQEGGRVMPLDTYARLKLLQLSGRSSHAGQPARAWLARLLLDPDGEAVATQKVFLVNHPELLEAAGVPEGKGRRYSFADLEPGLEKLGQLARDAQAVEEDKRSPLENDILRVHVNLNTFLELRHAFRFGVPDPHFTVTNAALRARWQLPADRAEFAFHEIFRVAGAFADEIRGLEDKPQDQWTEDQRTMFQLSSSLYRWSQFHQGLPPALLPVPAHAAHNDGRWLSPWDLYGLGVASEDLSRDLDRLYEMAAAYRAGNQAAFNLAATAFARSTAAQAAGDRGIRHLMLERTLNRLDPFGRAEWLYGLAFLSALLAILSGARGWRWAALGLVLVALVPHTFGLAGRMMIMGRPPVTNLYATFVFVSWICVVLGLLMERFQRNSLGTLLAAASGLVLLLVAGRFAAQGDTLAVLVAVLDSNFWLATHVVAITVGYAGCVAAGVAGLLCLAAAALRRAPLAAAALRATYGMLAFGLLFSFLGTMLGGVWADQSWGRFWGWDPKENGALLIVLWCSLLFHARISRMIGNHGFAAGSVLGIIVVLMAWLGINLLGVGLHSYGFTSGLALGFWLSCAVVALVAAAGYALARLRSPEPE